jgi:site-specific recombinase XerD
LASTSLWSATHGLLAGSRYRGDHLWLGYRFKPEAAHTLQLALVRVTRQAFGKPINPHLFRDCAATSIAIHNPASVRSAAAVLGHRSFATTEKYYNLAGSIQAGRLYAELICKRRAANAFHPKGR